MTDGVRMELMYAKANDAAELQAVRMKHRMIPALGLLLFYKKDQRVLEELHHRWNLDFFPPPPSSWSPPVIMYFSTLYPTHIDD